MVRALPLLLVLASSASADQSVPASPSTGWSGACRAAFEKVRARLSTLDQRYKLLEISVVHQGSGSIFSSLFGASDSCTEYDRLTATSSDGAFRADVSIGPGATDQGVTAEPWHARDRSGLFVRTRKEYRKRADLHVPTDMQGASALLAAAQSAADACFAAAGPTEYPWSRDEAGFTAACAAQSSRTGNPTAASCVAAEKAVRWIENMCEYEGRAVGYSGGEGDGWRALSDLVALGDHALPYFQRLAAAKNPVARLAAAEGLGRKKIAGARTVLDQLAKDTASASAREGCVGSWYLVSEAAKQSLKIY
jgi:hypothetical protein